MSFVLKYFDFYAPYIQSDPLSDCTESVGFSQEIPVEK